MSKKYSAAVVGAGRMGGTIDDEVVDHPTVVLPFSHGAAYAAMEGIDLIGFADVLVEKAETLAKRYAAPKVYPDYREMIERERPDIVSVCTRPGDRAEIIEFAAAHGVSAVYCEKPLAASMQEADRIVDVCESQGVKFNLGTNRRFLPSYHRLREVIASGVIGDLESITVNASSVVLWMHTHTSDLLMMLNGDAPVEFVQGYCEADPADFDDNRTEEDPYVNMGYVRFANGVNGYIVATTGYDLDVHCSKGKIRTFNDMEECKMWKSEGKRATQKEIPFPEYSHESAPVLIVRDLIQAIEEDGDTLNNVRQARRSQEIMMGIVESHRRNGERVTLPLENRSLYVGRW